MIYLLAGIASLGGVLFGYQTGVAAGALHLARNAWALDGRYLVLLSTGTLIGAMVGALSSGKLADLIGRRDVIMATAALFTLGAFVSAIAPSVHVLLLGRLIVGVAVGAMSVAAPLYIAEIAPPAKRGVLVCFFQLAGGDSPRISRKRDLLVLAERLAVHAGNGSHSWNSSQRVGLVALGVPALACLTGR